MRSRGKAVSRMAFFVSSEASKQPSRTMGLYGNTRRGVVVDDTSGISLRHSLRGPVCSVFSN